ncbi:MAG: hypothetical protein LBI05_00935 [Planctomycetaceae bacterium]|nr:hypothetical protein [Planctomycetaceae bacterium]
MSDIPSEPFESVLRAAETMSDPLSKSLLLSELAQQQLLTGQFDAALQTFTAIPVPMERRTALLVADFHLFPPEKIAQLVSLLKTETQTHFLAGQIALSMLEAGNEDSAWKLVETAGDSFESEQLRYEFLKKALTQLPPGNWEKILSLFQTFKNEVQRDWALLAMIEYLIGKQRYDEAEQLADSVTVPHRRSWIYWEMCRWSTAKPSERYWDKAIEILEAVEMTSDNEEKTETCAIQFRIYGQAAFQKGKKEQGDHLLEKSETAAASLTMPMQRFRLQCFLGKVLVAHKQITSIKEYAAIDSMLESLRSGWNRSRVMVWLAEAGWSEGWSRAIETLCVPERGVSDAERGEQIAQILKRYVAHHQGSQATGDSDEDSVRLSGEEFETRYFNPFAEADCGC